MRAFGLDMFMNRMAAFGMQQIIMKLERIKGKLRE